MYSIANYSNAKGYVVLDAINKIDKRALQKVIKTVIVYIVRIN